MTELKLNNIVVAIITTLTILSVALMWLEDLKSYIMNIRNIIKTRKSNKLNKKLKNNRLCYEPMKKTVELIEKSRKKSRDKLNFPISEVSAEELFKALNKLNNNCGLGLIKRKKENEF